MTRRLSSALTFFWKVVLPVVWVAGIVAGAQSVIYEKSRITCVSTPIACW